LFEPLFPLLTAVPEVAAVAAVERVTTPVTEPVAAVVPAPVVAAAEFVLIAVFKLAFTDVSTLVSTVAELPLDPTLCAVVAVGDKSKPIAHTSPAVFAKCSTLISILLPKQTADAS
jgi:hypothetical protein